MRKIKNTKECKTAEKQYLEHQEAFNKTGDLDILWGPMYQYILETSFSCAKKIVPDNGWIDKDGRNELSKEVAIAIINRYIKGLKTGKKYSKDLPITMVYLTTRALAWNGVGTVPKEQFMNDIDDQLNDASFSEIEEDDIVNNIKDVDDLED